MNNPDYAQLPAELKCPWTMNELIPLLVEAYPGRSWPYWKEGIRQAYLRISSLAIYEDFESTVERFRLLLVNPDILSRAEKEDFGFLRENHAVCIQVFVRHFVNHGEYQLHSLGKHPDPDHPRRTVTEQYQDTYVYAGKLAMRRSVFMKKHAAPWTRRRGQHKVLEATKVEEEVEEPEKEETRKEPEGLAVPKAPAENSVAIQPAQEVQHPLPQRPQCPPETRHNTGRRAQIVDRGTARRPPAHHHPVMPPVNSAPYSPGGMMGPPMPSPYLHQQNHVQTTYQNGPAYGPTFSTPGVYTTSYMPSLPHTSYHAHIGQGYGQSYDNIGPEYYQATPSYPQHQRSIVQSEHYPVRQNMRNDGQAIGAAFQPGANAYHFHAGASEFVPGANGHGF